MGLLPSVDDLDSLADERLADAHALLAAGRFAGAHYMCGYAMEMKLKSRICKTHEWAEYPPQTGDRMAQALKTHKLAELLLFTAMRPRIMETFAGPWSVVSAWDPEQRYRVAAFTNEEAQAMIAAVEVLMADL
jgi:H+/gluconate symporter-like permease